MKVTHYPKEILAEQAGKRLNEIFQERQGSPILFLISGGSALEILNHTDTSIFNSMFTIAVLDERYSHDENINNWAQIEKTTFFKEIKVNGVHYIDTKICNNESISELARRFEHQLREWRQNNPDGKIIATAGIGTDAHTSGIMPYPEDITFFTHTFENTNWVAAYDASGKNEFTQRITTTCTFIKENINYALLFATGASKVNALKTFLAVRSSIAEAPCRIWREIEELDVYTNENVTD